MILTWGKRAETSGPVEPCEYIKKEKNQKEVITMTSKRKALFTLMTSMALALILCLSMAVPAFAAGSPIYGTKDKPADAAITKMLKMPVTTTTPTVSFAFNITKKSLDGASGTADLAKMPPIVSLPITFSAADTGTVTGGTKYVPKESPTTLFAGVNWEHPGVYIYTITEIHPSPPEYPVIDPATGFVKESMVYSEAVYDVAVYVVPDENGVLYAYAIGATVMEIDTEDGAEKGDKVDPTPGGNPDIDGDYSKMIFTNVYVKNEGGTTPDYTTFILSKIVTGTEEVTGPGRLGTIFPFQITVTKPELVTAPQTYRAYVIDADGVIMDEIPTAMTTGNIGNDGNYDYIEFPSGTRVDVNLLHGEKLQFIDLHVGTKIAALEETPAGYTPKYQLTIAGDPKGVQPGQQGIAHGFPSTTDPLDKYTGEGVNKAEFTNMYQITAPTGISVNDLPYIALLMVGFLALAGFAGSMALKFRKNAKCIEA